MLAVQELVVGESMVVIVVFVTWTVSGRGEEDRNGVNPLHERRVLNPIPLSTLTIAEEDEDWVLMIEIVVVVVVVTCMINGGMMRRQCRMVVRGARPYALSVGNERSGVCVDSPPRINMP